MKIIDQRAFGKGIVDFSSLPSQALFELDSGGFYMKIKDASGIGNNAVFLGTGELWEFARDVGVTQVSGELIIKRIA